MGGLRRSRQKHAVALRVRDYGIQEFPSLGPGDGSARMETFPYSRPTSRLMRAVMCH